MKVLAIESSAVTASVAIMTEDTLIAEYTINYKKTHSQTLLPMINVPAVLSVLSSLFQMEAPVQ